MVSKQNGEITKKINIIMKEYKNVTFDPKMRSATDIINMEENQGLEYIETKYINEYEAVVIFRVLSTKIN